jgi:hypothetical protein
LLPELANFEAHCATLERIADSYPEGSPERSAIFAAVHALHFARHIDNNTKFRAWVDSWAKPPTALQVLNAKLAGIDDLPHELMDESMREIDQLMEKLRHKRA